MISLSANSENSSVFFPCGGPDADTEDVPEWVTPVSVRSICSVEESKLPITESMGISSKIEIGDNYFLAMKDQFEVGDIISFNSEKVTVFAVSDDFMSEQRNCVRVQADFKSQHNPQKFKIQRCPTLLGRIASVDTCFLQDFRLVEVKHAAEKKGSNVGNLFLSFHNFCFNQLGYLTHDTHHNLP